MRAMIRRASIALAALVFSACGSSDGGHAAAPAPSEPPVSSPSDEPAPRSPDEPAPRSPDELAPGASDPGRAIADAWGAILADYATEDGGFRYAALRDDREARAALDAVTQQIGASDPSRWSRDARLAFFLNAYNALTVKAVVDAWPIESVMRVDGFFDAATHEVAGEAMTLNHLENTIIRADEFAEPRIHFAVNCASAGCPWLRPTPYVAEALDDQLAEQAQGFVRRTTRVTDRRVELSAIFDWYAADFARVGGVRAFVASQLPEADAARVRDEARTISHVDYDWSVNAR